MDASCAVQEMRAHTLHVHVRSGEKQIWTGQARGRQASQGQRRLTVSGSLISQCIYSLDFRASRLFGRRPGLVADVVGGRFDVPYSSSSCLCGTWPCRMIPEGRARTRGLDRPREPVCRKGAPSNHPIVKWRISQPQVTAVGLNAVGVGAQECPPRMNSIFSWRH